MRSGALRTRPTFIDDIIRTNKPLGSLYSHPLLLPDSKESYQSVYAAYALDSTTQNTTTVNQNWTQASNETAWPFFFDMQHLVFVAMCLCLVTMVMFIIVALKIRHIFQRWRRKRRNGPRIAIIEAEAAAAPHTPQCYNNSRRGLLSRMLARIEEFDSLTPLIITPSSLSDDDHVPSYRPPAPPTQQNADRLSTTTNTASNTPVSFRGSPRRRPRCMAGKITLFPLASNARRAEVYTTEVASDSGDSVRATRIPANNRAQFPAANGTVNRNPFEDLDLISIDRTSGASTLDRRPTPNDLLASTHEKPAQENSAAAALALASKQSAPVDQRYQFQRQSLTAIGASSAGDVYPLSTIPSPASTDILIPISELHSSAPNLNGPNSAPINNNNNNNNGNNGKQHRTPNGNNHYRFVIKRESTSIDSLTSNLSSPMESSVCGDTGSPLDTTGSVAELSDSVYMASESENSEAMKNGSGRIYSLDTGSSQRWYTVSSAGTSADGSDRSEPDLSTFEYDAPAVKRYVLHRIEEESVDDIAAAATTATSSGDRSKRSASVNGNGKCPGTSNSNKKNSKGGKAI